MKIMNYSLVSDVWPIGMVVEVSLLSDLALRLEKRHAYVRKVAELAVQIRYCRRS